VDVEDGEAFLVGEPLLTEKNPIFAHTKARFSLEEIRDLVLNQGCSEERLLELLDGMTCEETVDLWGQPDGMTSGLWSHWWELDEKTGLVVFYGGSEGLITEVRIRTTEE